VFRSEAAGTYALKFYKQDFIRDFILNDHVQVLIGEAPEISGAGWFNPPVDRGRVIAEPRWPGTGSSVSEGSTDPIPAKPADSSVASSGTIPAPVVPAAPPRQTVIDEGITPVSPPSVSSPAKTGSNQTVVPSPSNAPPSSPVSPEEYLQKAREEFEAGRVAGALSVLDSFRERFPSGSDEAWWLYGQFYEANSPSRNIRLSLDYYRALIREYPQSNRYNDARSRIAYLERFYINIQ
jgi:TolA-binding protein